jgi:transposase InsO family protein
MPWEHRTVKEQRKEFGEAAQGCNNFSALCREFGISRATGYKWLSRFEAGEPLEDRSRRPRNSPCRISPQTEAQILELRQENPGWGARRIHCVMERRGCEDLPCVKTVNNVLQRHGCISAEESLKRKPYTRFEKDACNDMWQADFKGEFRTEDGRYCYPLDILDDHSRFAIRIAASDSTANVVIPCFQAAFREYGLPKAILSDNGAQFAGFRNGYTQFEKWLMCLDVVPIHGRIKHPQTQGKIERFHRSMKNEFLKHHSFADVLDANRGLQQWRNKYNFERPHEALGMKTPGSVYVPSDRPFPDKICPWEYSGIHHVIKVNSWGYVRFDKFQVYLSETMIDEHVEFRPSPDGDSFWVCFRNFKIAEYSTEDGTRLNRTISRL